MRHPPHRLVGVFGGHHQLGGPHHPPFGPDAGRAGPHQAAAGVRPVGRAVSAGGGTVGANVSLIWSSGRFGMSDERVYNTYGVRPVLNLSVDITLTGSGTMTDPYVVN